VSALPGFTGFRETGKGAQLNELVGVVSGEMLTAYTRGLKSAGAVDPATRADLATSQLQTEN